jgi:excisionase family DNA binding protein
MEGRPHGVATWPQPAAAESEPPPLTMLSVQQAARLYRMAPKRLYGLINDGTIPHIPVGRRLRVRQQAMDDYFVSLERSGRKPSTVP